MAKRLAERYDVDALRIMRGELRQWPNTGSTSFSEIVDGVVPGGSVYHILNDVPDDSGLELTVLVDGTKVVSFELPWKIKKNCLGRHKFTYLAGGPPIEVRVWPLGDYRREIGQGRHQKLLDRAVEDARRILG